MMTNTSYDQPRVSLCCEPGVYLRGSSCYSDTIPAEKIVLPDIYRPDLSISGMSPDEFLPRYSGTNCFVNGLYHFHSDLAENVLVYLLENGTIYLNDSIIGGKSFGIEDYCFASQMTENGTTSVVSVCLQVHYTTDARNLIIHVILCSVSIPFFITILVIYTIVPEARTVQRHVFRSYIAALCLGYIMNVGSHIGRVCYYEIMLPIQFLTLAIYFWLNVMSFDIWWTFRRLGSRKCSTKRQDTKRIIIYNCYAWGIPALMAGTGAILDFLPFESTGLIRPGLVGNCMLTSEAADLIYIIAPGTCALISNIFFFASTMINIIRQKRATAQALGGDDSRRHNDKARERFNLYLKLFIVMGMSRLATLIAWVFGALPDFIWYFFAAEGALQGPIIFFIYVWKRNTMQLLLNHLGLLTKIFRCKNSDNAAEQSSNIDGTNPNNRCYNSSEKF